jgi:ADP-heptose:LPS heptosyltransferase
MIRLPVIHFDCKYFEGDKPCFANKQYGVFCDNCSYYEKNADFASHLPEIPEGGTIPGSNNHKSILIIKLDAVGDVLRTTSILPSLKKQFPSSSISWATKSKSSSVLEYNPLIDSILLTEENLNEVVSRSFDIAINLDSGKASCEIMEKISSADKYGYTSVNGKPYPINSFANEWYLMGINDNFKKQNVKTYHKIIHEICGLTYENTRPVLEITEGRRIKSAQIREKSGLGNYEEFILINLGGGNRWQYKKWTKEGYAGLINKLSVIKPNSAIGLIAGKDDEEFYGNVLSAVNGQDNVIPLGCGNTVDEFICIIYLSDKIFTSDSLALHIATALNKYVIAIVGPTSHTELDVFGSGDVIYSKKVDCLACYLNRCGKTVTCMNTIGVKDVIDYFL